MLLAQRRDQRRRHRPHVSDIGARPCAQGLDRILVRRSRLVVPALDRGAREPHRLAARWVLPVALRQPLELRAQLFRGRRRGASSGPTTAKRKRAQRLRSPHPLLLPMAASLPALSQARCDPKRPYPSREEPLSADSAGPAPSVQSPVHGISQIRHRNSRERGPSPRMHRSSQTSGASPGATASSARFQRHIRVAGKLSRHIAASGAASAPGSPTAGRSHPGARPRTEPPRSPPRTTALHGNGPEETRRRRRHPPPAIGTAEAKATGIAAQRRRQTARLARVGRAVQLTAAMRAPGRAAGLRRGRVDQLEEGPHAGVGKDGVNEKTVRHWDCLWRLHRHHETSPPANFFARSRGGAPTPNDHPM